MNDPDTEAPRLDGLRVLYICYNGVAEPLVQSQVLNYQRGLAALGARTTLLTFEHQPPDEPAQRARMAEQGLEWHWLPYGGRDGMRGTIRDIRAGGAFLKERAASVDLVHARSFIPALMGLTTRRATGLPLLHDVRGFFAHEKRYKGRIGSEALFRILQRVEAYSHRNADGLVTLTRAAMDIIERERLADRQIPREVIPTCADVSAYERKRPPLNATAPVVVYSGSLGAGYLSDEVFAWFARLREKRPEATLRVLSRSDPAITHEAARRYGVSKATTLRSLTPAQMPEALNACDLALSFIQPGYAKIASCPTKMAEYLGAGLPVVANGGIGDVDSQLGTDRVGIVIDRFDDAAMDESVDAALSLMEEDGFIERARDAARRLFSVELGIERYARVYAAMRERAAA